MTLNTSAQTAGAPIGKLEGVQGRLLLYTDRVVITRKGLRAILTVGLQGDKTIPLDSVSSIQLKPGGAFTRGYLRFGIFGGNVAPGGLFAAVSDENSILFDQKFNAQAASVKEFVENWISRKHSTQRENSGASVADELRKLKSLMDDGIITADEFESQKKRLMS